MAKLDSPFTFWEAGLKSNPPNALRAYTSIGQPVNTRTAPDGFYLTANVMPRRILIIEFFECLELDQFLRINVSSINTFRKSMNSNSKNA